MEKYLVFWVRNHREDSWYTNRTHRDSTGIIIYIYKYHFFWLTYHSLLICLFFCCRPLLLPELSSCNWMRLKLFYTVGPLEPQLIETPYEGWVWMSLQVLSFTAPRGASQPIAIGSINRPWFSGCLLLKRIHGMILWIAHATIVTGPIPSKCPNYLTKIAGEYLGHCDFLCQTW